MGNPLRFIDPAGNTAEVAHGEAEKRQIEGGCNGAIKADSTFASNSGALVRSTFGYERKSYDEEPWEDM
jgi:hypothetical protein